eukprot:2805273-Pleurochrysis_carterae.AAC.1
MPCRTLENIKAASCANYQLYEDCIIESCRAWRTEAPDVAHFGLAEHLACLQPEHVVRLAVAAGAGAVGAVD